MADIRRVLRAFIEYKWRVEGIVFARDKRREGRYQRTLPFSLRSVYKRPLVVVPRLRTFKCNSSNLIPSLVFRQKSMAYARYRVTKRRNRS